MAQTTYTWTGGTDTDWNTVANWDANGIPVDDGAGTGLSLPDGSSVVFNGATMPDTNVPGFGGEYDGGSNGGTLGSPTIVLNSGGVLTMTLDGGDRGFWTNLASFDRQVITVGDGIGGAGEVTLTFTNDFYRMGRHNNGAHRVRVNSDGILNADVSCNRWGNSGSRPVYFMIDGGTINLNDTISGGNFNDGAFEFLSTGGALNFLYGGLFADEAAVNAAVGTKFVTNVADTAITVTDVGGTGVTMTLVTAEPNYWTGTGGATWDQSTTANFSTSLRAATLVAETFDIADPQLGAITFDDEYFDLGVSQPVTVNNINIGVGGVTGDAIAFLNSAVSYTLNSSDANGIASAASVSMSGGGSVTLVGTHAYSAVTTVGAGNTLTLGDGITDGEINNSPINSSGALVFDVVGDITRPQEFDGGGTFEKTGAGKLTVTGNMDTYSAAVTVTEGELDLAYSGQWEHDIDSVDIAAGTTLTYSGGGSFRSGPVVYTGAGTLRRTGANFMRWRHQAATFELSSGALISLEGNTETQGSSNANEVWTNNLSDLFVEAGSIFQGQEGNVRVDAINGAGEIRTGLDNAYYQDGFTFGVDNGSGDFTGVLVSSGTTPATSFFVKEGSGTQTFDGDSPNFIGDFIVEGGTLSFLFNSSTYFFPKGSGSTNSVSVATGATVNFGGIMTIDLSGAVAAPGSSWQLVDTSGGGTANYTPGDFIIFTEQVGVDFIETSFGSGVWELTQGIGTYTFTESTGTLTFDIAAGSNLWTGLGGVTWDQNTTSNFSDNDPADAISNVTFDTATATSLTAIFTDEYYASGAGTPVAQTGISIAAGGVQIVGGSVIFANVSAPYVITSTDAIGIYGDTTIDVNGNITLAGTHTTTGATTVGGGITLTLDAATAASYASPIGGDGNIVKTGGDTLTLTGAANFLGSTTITAGTLKFTQDSNSPTVTIASGAALEIDFNNRWGATTNISGDGTLRKSGANGINFDRVTFALSSGALIDIQDGLFIAGSSKNENWTANLSDLNIASGATFNTSEANVNVNVLTGAGTLKAGYTADAGYVQTTIGVDNGSDTFSGIIEDNDTGLGRIGNFVKQGTGTQTIGSGGLLTYSGFTRIEGGAITLDAGSSITLYPTVNGTTNGVAGAPITGTDLATCTLNLNGALNLDLTGTDTTPANSWLLVNATNLTANVGVTFSVTSTEGAFMDNLDGTWELDVNGNLWTFTVATATLEVAAGTPAGPTDEEISSGEFVANYGFDGTTASFSFAAYDGSTYEIRRTDDLTVALASWTTVYGPTVQVGDATIAPSDVPGALDEAFYILIITPAP